MRLPWRKPKPILQRDITLKVGTLIAIMDASTEGELDALAEWIESRRPPDTIRTPAAEELAKDIVRLDRDGPYR